MGDGAAAVDVTSAAEPRRLPRRLGASAATSLVIASMIGAGVFTTTGKLLVFLPSPLAVLACWALGGVAALCGALVYAELGSALPENGGEYHYLSRLYHPAVGFVAAWASLVVGFAAPLAARALAFGTYLRAFVPGVDPRVAALAVVLVLSAVNMWRVAAGADVQVGFTALKILFVLGLAGVGLWFGDASRLHAAPPSGTATTTSGVALGVLWVSFAYTGWGASSYVAGEVHAPARSLPRSLLIGTALVTLVYVTLNAAFLALAPTHVLADRLDVADAAFSYRFGALGGKAVSLAVLLGLVPTIGALIVTGPRIYEAVGRDLPRLRWLAQRGDRGGPLRATVLQSGLAIVMLAWAGFDALLTYIGFTLSLVSALAVAGVFVVRRRGLPASFRTPGYPITPALYVALAVVSAGSGLVELPLSGLFGLATLALGLGLYRIAR